MEEIQTLLRPDGTLEGEAPDVTDEFLVDLLRWMVRVRVMDTRLLNLQPVPSRVSPHEPPPLSFM